MQSFWDWFIGEAGAAWIIGIIGTLGAVYTWLKRPRPPKVIVQEVERLKLLDIHPSQQDNVKVLYVASDGRQEAVRNLEQKKFVIYNSGTRDILEPVELKLRFFQKFSAIEDWRFWRTILDDPECTYELLPPIGEDDDKWVDMMVKINYLNSCPVHKHYVRLFLISDGTMEIAIVKGAGKGWSAQLASLDSIRERQRPIAFIIMGLVLLGLFGLLHLISLSLPGVYGWPVFLLFFLPVAWYFERLVDRVSIMVSGIRPVREFES